MKRQTWCKLLALAILVALLIPAVATADHLPPNPPVGRFWSYLGRTPLELTLGDRGEFVVAIRDAPYLEGSYELGKEFIYFSDPRGRGDCDLTADSMVTYRWTYDGHELWFVAVEDNCWIRQLMLTSRPWYPRG